ncbi:hypothetical protein [Haloplanus salinus]|uniref:hypothetical protein n=1 Tax=Haloplanus salinus TaxID=1126245 RepID=UPI000DF4231C|nr:hypothetical protein [Haloplanus salinus]
MAGTTAAGGAGVGVGVGVAAIRRPRKRTVFEGSWTRRTSTRSPTAYGTPPSSRHSSPASKVASAP